MKKQWWHNGTAYQIYPKSFCDSNGDGIGDLQGIISKLDYLKDLGVDIIWLSPIYVSPLADEGYDIADYYDIDPRFGTLEDMDELLKQAHARKMHILMDLVVNHCSDENEWFKKACEDPEGTYGKYFYLEHTKDKKSLSNMRSYFGGSVWEELPGQKDWYYLHLFHKKQPDLNWENPVLREEVYKMVNWWLERGVDGFRLDAIINIKKALPFKNYPADREDGLATCTAMIKEAEGVGDFLTELKERCFTPHHAFTVGEVFEEKPDAIRDFIGDGGYFNSMYDFGPVGFGWSDKGWWDYKDITPDDYKACVFSTQKKVADIGMISNIIENHDEPRGVSHYIPEGDQSPESKKMLATLYFLLKGLPWIYQGQEIGMENVKVSSIDEVDDISSIGEYKVALEAGLTREEALRAVEKYGRDNARTPFQWDDGKEAGFTTGKPWLRVNPNKDRINLKSQRNDPQSVYQYYRKLTRLKKDPAYTEVLTYGELVPYLEERPHVMAYLRKNEEQKLLVIANFQKEPQTLPLPAEVKKVVLSSGGEVKIQGREAVMEGYQALVLELV